VPAAVRGGVGGAAPGGTVRKHAVVFIVQAPPYVAKN